MGADDRRDEKSVVVFIAVLIVGAVGLGGEIALDAVGEAVGLQPMVAGILTWTVVVAAFVVAATYLVRAQRRGARD